MPYTELKSEVVGLIEETILVTKKKIEFCIYDNGCKLEHAVTKNNVVFRYTDKIRFYIDKLHISNHIDKCHEEFNLANDDRIKDLNSVICEQNFSLMRKFKHALKHMGQNNYMFFLLFVYDNLNSKKI